MSVTTRRAVTGSDFGTQVFIRSKILLRQIPEKQAKLKYLIFYNPDSSDNNTVAKVT